MTNFIENINFATQYLGNSVLDYAKALGLFIILLIAFKAIQYIILKRLGKLAKKTKTDIDDTLIDITKSLRPSFYWFLAFFFAVKFLTLSVLATKAISGILVIWAVYQIIKAVQILLNYILNKKFTKEDNPSTKAAIIYVNMIAKFLLWAIGLLLILSNLGIDVTSLIAGLGIGGVAIAFALQNILSDLFSSFAIYFDKPFQIGDFIVSGSHSGTVEKIGIKTTRIRALQGEEIVISNNELTGARVQNFKKMEKRRVVSSFGILYETPIEKIKNIKQIVKNIFNNLENTELSRVHFKQLGDFSLNFEVVYNITTGDYNTYMDAQEKFNLALMEAFESEGIEFAYPTQKLFVAK
ncbi:mechanosensitive ion channel [bacterium]|jgi:small-conductance mechanosensitive channel|nr:mechanosensitive ion channel [bacterium]MBT3729892.1 mechanosensitive ion channel [bacterium]